MADGLPSHRCSIDLLTVFFTFTTYFPLLVRHVCVAYYLSIIVYLYLCG